MYCCGISTYLVAWLIAFHRRYLHALRWGVLRHGGEVLRDLWHKRSQDLFHDSFQSCETSQNRTVWGLIPPYQRRRRCLISRMEEETAPTSKVGTSRPPPALRPNKESSWLCRMRFHLGSSRRGLPHSDLSQNDYGSLSLLLSVSLSRVLCVPKTEHGVTTTTTTTTATRATPVTKCQR